MTDWKLNDAFAPIETKAGWRTITRREYFFPDGSLHAFDLVGRLTDKGVAVLGLTKDHKIVVARQYRPGPGKTMNELPGGLIENDETPEQAARREFREETGYEAGEIELLGTAHHDGYATAPHSYFIAYNCYKAGEPQPEPNEWIEPKELAIQEFLESAKQGGVIDAAAVLMAHDRLQEIAAAAKQ